MEKRRTKKGKRGGGSASDDSSLMSLADSRQRGKSDLSLLILRMNSSTLCGNNWCGQIIMNAYCGPLNCLLFFAIDAEGDTVAVFKF